jgi:hypothetical protein
LNSRPATLHPGHWGIPRECNQSKFEVAAPPAREEQPASSVEIWFGTIESITKTEGHNARGPWTLYRINLEDGKTCTTFDQALAADVPDHQGGRGQGIGLSCHN